MVLGMYSSKMAGWKRQGFSKRTVIVTGKLINLLRLVEGQALVHSYLIYNKVRIKIHESW